MKKDFVKVKDLELQLQLTKFHTELLIVGSNLGFSAAEIEEAGNDAAGFSFIMTALHAASEYQKALTNFKNSMKAGIGGPVVELPVLTLGGTPVNVADGIVTRLRAKAAKAKSSPNYTVTIGLQLGIEGDEIADENPDFAKPDIGGLLIAGSKVNLKWKKGTFDGIRVFKKVDDGEFTLTGFSVSPPYIDKTPLPVIPQVWSYIIQYFIDDDEVGSQSEQAAISVSTSIASV